MSTTECLTIIIRMIYQISWRYIVPNTQKKIRNCVRNQYFVRSGLLAYINHGGNYLTRTNDTIVRDLGVNIGKYCQVAFRVAKPREMLPSNISQY